MSRIVNLDRESPGGTVFLITFKGVHVSVTKERLQSLLEAEQAYLQLLAGGAEPPAPLPDRTPKSEPASKAAAVATDLVITQLPTDRVSHASLSSRIKKIYNYSASTGHLRPAHQEFLTELIGNFDWVLPEHPNTRMDVHLAELLERKGVTKEFRAVAESFLRRYRELRSA